MWTVAGPISKKNPNEIPFNICGSRKSRKTEITEKQQNDKEVMPYIYGSNQNGSNQNGSKSYETEEKKRQSEMK